MSEWQPIETAPRNPAGELYGPRLVLWHSEEPFMVIGRWLSDGEWLPDDTTTDAGYWREECMGHEIKPTHWMLPEPPRGTGD